MNSTEESPTYIKLAHEMIHAIRLMRGNLLDGYDKNFINQKKSDFQRGCWNYRFAKVLRQKIKLSLFLAGKPS